VMLYLYAKFDFNSPNGLGCVFYTTMGSAAILDPIWRPIFLINELNRAIKPRNNI